MNNMETKQCRVCREQINKNAKKCPRCGAKQGKEIWLIVVIVIIVLGIIAGVCGNSENSLDTGSGNSENSLNTGSGNSSSQKQENIEYIKVSKDDLDEALESNAAAAKDTYNNKYVEITGELGTIDSDLKYISLMSSTDEWDIIGIHCTIKNNDQKEIVKTLTNKQEITIRGKITDVGEVLGYYLDITEIIAN